MRHCSLHRYIAYNSSQDNAKTKSASFASKEFKLKNNYYEIRRKKEFLLLNKLQQNKFFLENVFFIDKNSFSCKNLQNRQNIKI